jgi:hypothetical protein
VLYSSADSIVEIGVLVWLLVELKWTEDDDRAWDGTVLSLAERMLRFKKKRLKVFS